MPKLAELIMRQFVESWTPFQDCQKRWRFHTLPVHCWETVRSKQQWLIRLRFLLQFIPRLAVINLCKVSVSSVSSISFLKKHPHTYQQRSTPKMTLLAVAGQDYFQNQWFLQSDCEPRHEAQDVGLALLSLLHTNQ